jgi:hypothetical protein
MSSNGTTNENMSSGNTMTYYFVGTTIMVVVGLVTNVLNLIVLSLKSMKSTTNKYLWALAICDVFVLVLSHLSVLNSFSSPDYSDMADSLLINDDLNLNNETQTTFTIGRIFKF